MPPWGTKGNKNSVFSNDVSSVNNSMLGRKSGAVSAKGADVFIRDMEKATRQPGGQASCWLTRFDVRKVAVFFLSWLVIASNKHRDMAVSGKVAACFPSEVPCSLRQKRKSQQYGGKIIDVC